MYRKNVKKHFKKIGHLIVMMAMFVVVFSCDKKSEPKVGFANLTDGQTVTSPVTVEMTVEGMEIAPAGEVIEGVGHFHISINSDVVPEGELIPTSETSFHYGEGQTSTELTLSSGEQVLTLQFGDGIHRAYDSEYAKTITVIVE